MLDIGSIKVTKDHNNYWGEVLVENPNNYTIIGIGFHGVVFKLSEDKCVKVFADPDYARREIEAYKAFSKIAAIPKLFEVGPDYIVIEYIRGKELYQYFLENGELTLDITAQIVYFLNNFIFKNQRLNDIELNNIIIDKRNKLRVVDLVEITTYYETPIQLFRHFMELGLIETFLSQVYILDRKLYNQWKVSMDWVFKN